MKIGLNMWTVIGFEYKGVPTIEEVLKYAAEVGYDGVEFCYDDGLLHPAKIDKDTRKKYLELIKSLGKEFSSVATGVFWKYNMGSPDESLRKKGIEFVKLGLELARDLEAKVLLVVPAVAHPDIPYEKMYEIAQSSLKECAKYAEDLGVIIGVENVWNKFLYSPLEYKRFIEEIGSEYVKAYLDVGNILNLGYPEHWITLLGAKLIACVHVKDFDINVGNITGFRHVGRGSMNWEKILKLLKDVGYDYYLVVECPPEFYPELEKPKYPEDGYRAAKDNVAALKELLKKIY